MGVIELRAHHIENVIYFKFVDFKDYDFVNRKYSSEMRDVIRGIYERLIDNPSTKIFLVEGLDDICNSTNPKCDQITEKCSESGMGDNIVIDCYELKIGKEYTFGELLRIGEEFRERTGFLTPLNLFWRTNDIEGMIASYDAKP